MNTLIIRKNINLIVAFILLIASLSTVYAKNDKLNTAFETLTQNKTGITSDKNNEWDVVVPDDFFTIQEAIDYVGLGNGYRVYVKSGDYVENIVINTDGIVLHGEDKENTIITGLKKYDVITIQSKFTNISGFTIENSGKSGRDAGIETNSDNNIIENNIFINNTIGLRIYNGSNNTIQNNIFISNKDYGIFFHYSHNNRIKDNVIQNNRWGIYLIYSNLNIIENNNITNNKYNGLWISRTSKYNIIKNNQISVNNNFGIYVYNSNKNIINNNVIINNFYGIFLFWSDENQISYNNFLNNKYHASFIECNNIWNQNYWNKSMSFPKIIFENPFLKFPEINIDRNPAKEPYNNYENFLTINLDKKEYKNKDNLLNKNDQFPSYFCWQDINGTDFTTPIKNQAPAPTCETYALCASLETIIQYKIGVPFNCDLSETHLYFYSGGTCAAGGVLIGDAAEYLIDFGVPDEGCFPDPHRSYDYDFKSIEGWENRTVKIQEWGWVDYDIISMKRALIDYGPLIVHFMVRPGFNLYKKGIYQPSLGEIIGGHLVTIIGYDDSQQCWVVKNSWGENWGDNGYVKISYQSDKFYNPFIWPFYGGTGIMYLKGIYGNLKPDVPKIHIEKPMRHYTYFFGMELPTIFKNILSTNKTIPRIIGWTNIKINGSNLLGVEFYFDEKLEFVDVKQPFEWKLENKSKGFHTIEAYAFNNKYKSKDIIDIIII